MRATGREAANDDDFLDSTVGFDTTWDAGSRRSVVETRPSASSHLSAMYLTFASETWTIV